MRIFIGSASWQMTTAPDDCMYLASMLQAWHLTHLQMQNMSVGWDCTAAEASRTGQFRTTGLQKGKCSQCLIVGWISKEAQSHLDQHNRITTETCSDSPELGLVICLQHRLHHPLKSRNEPVRMRPTEQVLASATVRPCWRWWAWFWNKFGMITGVLQVDTICARTWNHSSETIILCFDSKLAPNRVFKSMSDTAPQAVHTHFWHSLSGTLCAHSYWSQFHRVSLRYWPQSHRARLQSQRLAFAS